MSDANNSENFTVSDVANWMLEQVENKKQLFQHMAVMDIQKIFGKSFVDKNPNGNNAISPKVLKEYNKISSEKVVWARYYGAWRLRKESDDPKKRQVDV